MEIIFFILLSFAIEAVCLCRIFALTFGGRESCGLERLAKGLPRPQQIAIACVVLVAAVIYGGSKPGAPVGAPTSPSAHGDFNAEAQRRGDAEDSESSAPPRLCASALKNLPPIDPTDSDGDGIPDIYERWTHSDPQVADSHLDRDNDGLTDLEEYYYQTDPRRPDTDNDGLSDWHETASPLAEEYALNPVAKETFIADEPDENANNIPDIWDESPHNFGFTDANNDGFDDNYARQYLPDASGENFDIIATVSSSRTACLTWGASASAGEGMILPPCTNLAVRLRLDATRAGTVRLIAAPDGVELAGLWKASLKLSLDERRGHEIERNRARFGDGKIIEHEEGTGRFIGFLGSAVPQAPVHASAPAHAPAQQQQQQFNTNSGSTSIGGIGGGAMLLSSGGSGGSGGVSKNYYSPSIEIGALYPRCRIHGPGLVVTAIVENVSMPLLWMTSGVDGFVKGDVLFYSGSNNDVTITCKGGGTYERIVVYDTETFYSGICETNTLAIKGAAWGSTHSHTNASDHLPLPPEVTIVEQFGPLCPPVTNTTVTIGFTHSNPIKTRNLICIASDGLNATDHCMGVAWERGGKINLWSLLHSNYLPYKDRLAFTTTNSKINADGELGHGNNYPEDLWSRICHIQVVDKEDGNKMLDQLWIVIGFPLAERLFNNWCAENASLNWTVKLPPPFTTLAAAANSAAWEAPTSNSSFLHHNAAFTMRSAPAGQHGHQAAYDSSGKLITSTIAAGTADRFAPSSNLELHRVKDVLPFIRALQLDGNPVHPANNTILSSEAIPTNLSRPCIYQGSKTDTYISLRPPTPTGVQK